MFRTKLSWLLGLLVFLAWSIVVYEFSAFCAESPQQFVWTATTKPIPGTPTIIEMKPSMLVPVGTPAAPMRSLLTRVLGKSLGGFIPSAGVVFQILDLENQRQTVAYAIEQLMKDGQPVSPQTIQEWIAAQNGIDTTGDSLTPYYEGGTITHGGYVVSVTPAGTYMYSTTAFPGLPESIYETSTGINGPRSSTYFPGAVWCYYKATPVSSTVSYYNRYTIQTATPQPAFDPATRPDIFGPDAYPEQAIDALENRDLDSFDIELVKTNGDLYDHVPIDVDSGQPTADPNFWEFLAKGLKYIAPISALGDAVVARFNLNDGTVKIETDKGTVELSKGDSTSLINNGVPEGAKIVRVDPDTGTVTYVDPSTGETKTAQVPKTDASNLTNNYNVYNTVNNSTKTTNIHQEINLPEVHVSGELKTSNATLEPVAQERVEAAKARFQESWQNLKQTFSEMFSVTLTGAGRLPTWTWVMLGQTVIIDFNEYAVELNWLSLAFLFLATISAVFIVINN